MVDRSFREVDRAVRDVSVDSRMGIYTDAGGVQRVDRGFGKMDSAIGQMRVDRSMRVDPDAGDIQMVDRGLSEVDRGVSQMRVELHMRIDADIGQQKVIGNTGTAAAAADWYEMNACSHDAPPEGCGVAVIFWM